MVHNMFVNSMTVQLQAKDLVPLHLLDTQVDPACFELSGHLVLKRAADFEDVSQVCHYLSFSHCLMFFVRPFGVLVQAFIADVQSR